MFEGLLSAVIQSVLGIGTGVASSYINQAINPPPKQPGWLAMAQQLQQQQQQQQPGFMGNAQGAGTAQRPAAMNFSGGFTGQPPAIPSGPVVPPAPGGFSTIDRLKPIAPTGGI